MVLKRESGDRDRPKLCRNEINGRTSAIRGCFKWGTARELVPGWMLEALKSLEPLRTTVARVRDNPPRQDVERWVVEATVAEMVVTCPPKNRPRS